MPNTASRGLLLEITCWTLAVAVLVFFLRTLLVSGTGILPHDNFFWCYPVFHFFAENLIHGHFPLWDPFMHGGEPFYPLLAQIRLLEPLPILVVWVAHFFSSDTVLWFNWLRFIESLVMVAGVYLVYRPLARSLWTRLSLIPILLFSSIFLGTFPQDGILSSFLWVPYQAWFLLRLLHGRGSAWTNWIALAILVGLNWQSYYFAGTWVFLLFVFVGAGLFRRRALRRVFRSPDIRSQLFVVSAILIAMAMPNLALLMEQDRFVFPLRMAPPDYARLPPFGGPIRNEGGPSFITHGSKMPYDFVLFTGGSSQFWDILQMVAPDGNSATHGRMKEGWGRPSESYLYLGLLPWAISLFGLFFGRHFLKPVLVFLTGGFGLLMLGPRGGLHELLYPIYPPLWFIRNTGMLVLFCEFGMVYFFVLGMNRLWTGRKA